jgi:Na+/H+ antiporter NhaD/arsenite permease-like protein
MGFLMVLVLVLVLLAPRATEEAPLAAAAQLFGAASGAGPPPDAFEEAWSSTVGFLMVLYGFCISRPRPGPACPGCR